MSLPSPDKPRIANWQLILHPPMFALLAVLGYVAVIWSISGALRDPNPTSVALLSSLAAIFGAIAIFAYPHRIPVVYALLLGTFAAPCVKFGLPLGAFDGLASSSISLLTYGVFGLLGYAISNWNNARKQSQPPEPLGP